MKILFAISAFIGLVVLFALLGSIPVWLLWNALMPSIFGLKAITWVQALGLLLLSGCLFKSSSNSSKD